MPLFEAHPYNTHARYQAKPYLRILKGIKLRILASVDASLRRHVKIISLTILSGKLESNTFTGELEAGNRVPDPGWRLPRVFDNIGPSKMAQASHSTFRQADNDLGPG